ncbi:DnaD domain-containing protein [Metabacillus halosaccharovorans]|uniref:DnaD domain protein n=1 Tax=Metabacillus halosaccharovorans TaxID=930124 RepID=A0ABT3DHV2_9BACI|nr:DnaD domain protein [Metabacillus halosaccharovorans]MCV9886624.1 DnaD domain protein [Metabacillus halosaccharovorans]
MARYRMINTDFWMTPIVGEELTADERYLYIYLLTNYHTTQIGIYRILKKQIAVEMGFSLEHIESLMGSLDQQHNLIRYNPETREVALINWGNMIHSRGGKPVIDCIDSELRKVVDTSLISYVLDSIKRPEIRSLYEKFYDRNGNNYEDGEDTPALDEPIRRQKKEEEKEKEKKQQQKALKTNIENNPNTRGQTQNQYPNDVKEIIEFWDNNGFGYSNINAKQQLLAWLDDSHFSKPKDVILKALMIACSNNKRKLNYVVGILKNWENESLLTVEEIEDYQQSKKQEQNTRNSTHSFPTGRDIPRGFELDLTAGEE